MIVISLNKNAHHISFFGKYDARIFYALGFRKRTSWVNLKPILIPVSIITIVTIITVILFMSSLNY